MSCDVSCCVCGLEGLPFDPVPQGHFHQIKISLPLSLSAVDMQSLHAASPVQPAYGKADGVQSNIPRHCPCPLPPLVQGVVRIRLWAVHACWRVALPCAHPARGEVTPWGMSSINLRHFSSALHIHTPGRTTHCTHTHTHFPLFFSSFFFPLWFFSWGRRR